MLQSFFQKSKSIFGVVSKENTSFEKAEEATTLDDENSRTNNLSVASDKMGNLALDNEELKETIYDFIRNIRDPEKPATLEDLAVVYEDCIIIKPRSVSNTNVIRIEFNPTVPHCSLATLIGLCIRIKLERNLPEKFKLDIFIKKGAHTTENEINKQINDKERIAAAMENPELRNLVEKCILEED